MFFAVRKVPPAPDPTKILYFKIFFTYPTKLMKLDKIMCVCWVVGGGWVWVFFAAPDPTKILYFKIFLTKIFFGTYPTKIFILVLLQH